MGHGEYVGRAGFFLLPHLAYVYHSDLVYAVVPGMDVVGSFDAALRDHRRRRRLAAYTDAHRLEGLMIECIFTIDYEIYGNGTGSLRDLVLEPAARLADLFRLHDV